MVVKTSLYEIAKKHIRWFMKKLKSDSVDSYSAQVSFFIIISFIPFMMFLLSLFQTININGMSMLNFIIDIFPEQIGKVLWGIFPHEREPFTILSLSAVTSIWSASMAMLALIKGLNSVFDAKISRNYIWLRITSIIYTIIFAVILVFTALLLIFGNTLFERVFKTDELAVIFSKYKFIVSFIILATFFTFSFKIIPLKSEIKLRFCVIGGSLASLGWVVYSFLFSIFVEHFADYSNVYGSLATLVVFMLWLYFCMYIMFIGGELAVWLQTSDILKDIKVYRKQQKQMKQKTNMKRIK